MRLSLKIVAVLLLGLVCGCSSYHVRTTRDEFNGDTSNWMLMNRLAGGALLDVDTGLELNPARFIVKNKTLYVLTVAYSGKDWIFIDKGESLVLLVDSQRLGFSGEGSLSSRNVHSGGSVLEQAIYEVSLKDLITIANATEVKVRVMGSSGLIDRHFKKANFKNFKKFVTEYGK